MPFRQHAKRVADSGQRDANTLRNFDNRHRAQNVTPVAPLIAGIPLTVDQSFTLIKWRAETATPVRFATSPGVNSILMRGDFFSIKRFTSS